MTIRSKLKWLDPFHYVDLLLEKLNPLPKKSFSYELFNWVAYIVFGLLFAYILYSLLGFAFQTSSPLVIVVSGSMEPVLHRGDIVFLRGAPSSEIQANEVELHYRSLDKIRLDQFARVNYSGSLVESVSFKDVDGAEQTVPVTKSGNVIVYNSNLRNNFPIIHRAVIKIKAGDGYYFLTKGDNIETNNAIDQDCSRSCIHAYPVKQSEIQGVQFFSIPYLGCVKLIPFEGRC